MSTYSLCLWCPWESSGVILPETGIIDTVSCSGGAGNQTPVLWKGSQCFWLLSHLSSLSKDKTVVLRPPSYGILTRGPDKHSLALPSEKVAIGKGAGGGGFRKQKYPIIKYNKRMANFLCILNQQKKRNLCSQRALSELSGVTNLQSQGTRTHNPWRGRKKIHGNPTHPQPLSKTTMTCLMAHSPWWAEAS
jgi:hypothetical protein